MAGRKRSWEQESLSLGDVLSFSRRMLSLAKQARDLGEATGLPRGSVRNLASLLLDIEDGVKAQTGEGLTDKIQEYLTTLIPQEPDAERAAGDMSEVDKRIQEVNATLTQLYGAGWLRGADQMARVFRVWEKLVAAGYSLPREQFEQGSEYAHLVDDFYSRLKQVQPSKESTESLATMVEPMADRAKDLVRTRGIEDLPDTGFSGDVRGNPNYVRVLLEAVANRRPRQYW
jgi:hypothetical protein